jgi:hypothetical protein
MALSNITIPTVRTLIPVDTRTNNLKVLLMPTVSTNSGQFIFFKDYYGTASNSTFTISTTGTDLLDDLSSRYTFSNAFGSMGFVSDGLRSWRTIGLYNGDQTPAAPVASFAATAASYLPLLTNATDIGTIPQTVTTIGAVSYTTIGGKQTAYFSNSLSVYLSLPYLNPTLFTLCFWYYPIDAGSYTVVSVTNSSVNPALQFDTTSATSLTSYASLPNQWTVGPTATVPGVGNWKFITWTLNQTTFAVQFYVNGVLATTATGSGTAFASRNLWFIGRSGDNGRAFNGYVRQFAVYNRILNVAEINQYYTETA